MNSILLATDGSDHAAAALEVCAALARQHGAGVTVAHVVTDHRPDEAARRLVEVEYVDEFVERCRGALLRDRPAHPEAIGELVESGRSEVSRIVNSILGGALTSRAGAALHARDVPNVSVQVAEGDPAERVLELADEAGCDAIVMGCRGRSRIAGALVGSVSSSVAHRADCRVVLVK